jgi:hypothetical protein
VFVAVWDAGPAFDWANRPAHHGALTGRGLSIVAALATNHGVRSDTHTGKSVWCIGQAAAAQELTTATCPAPADPGSLGRRPGAFLDVPDLGPRTSQWRRPARSRSDSLGWGLNWAATDGSHGGAVPGVHAPPARDAIDRPTSRNRLLGRPVTSAWRLSIPRDRCWTVRRDAAALPCRRRPVRVPAAGATPRVTASSAAGSARPPAQAGRAVALACP